MPSPSLQTFVLIIRLYLPGVSLDTPALAVPGHIEVLASAGVAEHRAATGVVPAGGVGPHTLGVQPGSLALSGDGDGGAEEAGDVLHRSQPQAGVRAAGASVQGHTRPPLGGHGGRLAEVHNWATVPEQGADAPHSVRVAVEEPLHVPAHGVQLLVADPAVVATMPGVQTQVVPTALRSRPSAGYQQGFRYIL